MGPVGVQEMIVIFLVALVLFGPKKLPELGKTIGKAITEFRRAQSDSCGHPADASGHPQTYAFAASGFTRRSAYRR